MKKVGNKYRLSAGDLVGHLNCRHLTALDIAVADGAKQKPDRWDPLLEILRERGKRHEEAYIGHLKSEGLKPTIIEGVEITHEVVKATLEAMSRGDEIIVQGALTDGVWAGRLDILRRIEEPSELGEWSYEVIDTKLARETKGGTLLQLCLYNESLAQAQGAEPKFVHVVAPWSDFEPQSFRFADYAAYYRQVKNKAERAIQAEELAPTYPDPKAHCDVCRWQEECDAKRRDDDHLCLVAGITRAQMNELQAHGVTTVASLAELPSPMPWKPERGAPASYERVAQQARIQKEAETANELKYEVLMVSPGSGFSILPAPSAGDVFFDIEGDPFVGEGGIEYLFGYSFYDDEGEWQHKSDWAFDRDSEKKIFENFIEFVVARRERYPDLHIYHFSPYEPGALKRLMGRYATCEQELDRLLRGKCFIDLWSVTKNSLRASVESYSLKQLEPFYEFVRDVPLREANLALTQLSAALELQDLPSLKEETRERVAAYNHDDCRSTASLREWLEAIRAETIESGTDIPRPPLEEDAPSEELSERDRHVQELIERLTADVPADPEARSIEQQARWILAHILNWHRREDKATWWEYFRLKELTPVELLDERAALGGLKLIGVVDQTKTGIPTHRYEFIQQDTDIRGDESLKAAGGDALGTALEVSTDQRTIDIKKMKATADLHPEAAYAFIKFPTHEQANSLLRIGEYVADNGIEGDGPFKSARSLLMLLKPDTGGEEIQSESETPLEAAVRLAAQFKAGVLPIQGPPGTGKSYTGARMICALVREGKKVGITANSHKVIRNLLDKVIEAAAEMEVELHCIQKPKSGDSEPNQPHLTFTQSNDEFLSALRGGRAQVGGATQFLWSREGAQDSIDVLVVDEAAQMSLANVLAVSPAAPALVLIGDPQQLDQPTQGTHPDGTGVSSLEHIIGEQQTISSDQGLFLGTTWRLHPEICAFNSELFYNGKLHPKEHADRQKVLGGEFVGAGLRYVPVHHSGNTSSSIEEAERVHQIVRQILDEETKWIDRDGNEHPVTMEDILIIAPYNAQVFEIQQRLPNAKVGTVDKFQGQEAPIAIYSMATSSHADAPRGMEFLYSANRFNVAISRAKCLAILVASPEVFEADCKTPRQMQLANAFCRYLERV